MKREPLQDFLRRPGMAAARKDNVAIGVYLRKRLEYLQAFSSDIENRLSGDVDEFINRCDDKNICSTFLFHIDCVVGNTLRYSMVLAICAFLEESVRLLCARSVSDYEKVLGAYPRGTWLARHRKLLAQHTSLGLAEIKDDLNIMEQFVQVRNCIAHAWGKLAGCRNERQLREIVRRVDYFTLSADEYLLVADHAVPTAVTASGQIVNKMLQGLLRLPGHCVY